MISRRVVAFSAVLCVVGYVWVYANGLADAPIRSDGFSYYVYLPSWFIFGDTTLAALARDCCGGQFPEFSAIIRWPGTRRWVNAHPIGVAIMQMPSFAVAHGLTRWSNLSADGFTLYYQHAAGLAGLAWIVAGLAVLRRLLLDSFSDRATAATLAAILFGTNLFHYATFDSSYSHPYSFFLFSSFMYLTARWHDAPSPGTSVLLGLVAGLIVLVRHTNVLFLVVFPLYGIGVNATVRDVVSKLFAHRRELMRIAVVGALVVLPQLLVYYQATGRPIVSSYGDLGFHWTDPKIFGVLLGTQKGLFFWSPLLLLSIVGLVMLGRSRRPGAAFVPAGVTFLVVNTYVIASWWDWQFGGSYGHRGFVDILPLFALGLGAFFAWAAQRRETVAMTAAVVLLLVSLSTFQMFQYWYGIVPFSDTTWEQYRALFLEWR